MAEKVLTIRCYEITSRLPYNLFDITTLDSNDQIILCQQVYNDIGDMFLWYATIDESSKTYQVFQSVSNYDVSIDETGLIVTFLGDSMNSHDIYDELAHALGEGILFPTSEIILSGKKVGYSFQLL